MDSLKNHISKRDAALVSFLCALLGGALGWIAFSSPDGVRVPKEAGNAADWIAAIAGVIAAAGTWAIGLGANRYAKEAHMQRVTEQLQLRSDALEARMRRFNVILFKVRRATRLERVAAHAVQDGYCGPLHIPFMIDSLEALARVGATLKWPIEEVVLLNLPSQQLLDAIEGRLLGALAMLDFMRPFGKNDTEQFRRQFNAVVGACLAVKKYAEPLSSRLEARLEELSKEMLEVQAKLAVLNPSVRHD
ncbi:hypothetical protein [Stenotrophomonas muris]|uniref:hypothetical protein n=1 Tax=Stenotrophomonas muris TaxID=2963283 RepID=UPI002E77C262|nr:hypothetical protein [Stenotrophomonas muris]